jgi:hypothetical protein
MYFKGGEVVAITKQNQLKLTPEVVLDLRNKFYRNLWPYSDIMALESVTVSKNIVIDAIKGNRGYAKIKDDIPQELKDNRITMRETYPQPTRAKEQRLRAQIKWPVRTYTVDKSTSYNPFNQN